MVQIAWIGTKFYSAVKPIFMLNAICSIMLYQLFNAASFYLLKKQENFFRELPTF